MVFPCQGGLQGKEPASLSVPAAQGVYLSLSAIIYAASTLPVASSHCGIIVPASASATGMPGPRGTLRGIGQPQGDSVLTFPPSLPSSAELITCASQRFQQSLMLCVGGFGALVSDFGRKATFSLPTGAEKTTQCTSPPSLFPFQVIFPIKCVLRF